MTGPWSRSSSNPGASARTTDRPALQRLLARIRTADTKIGAVLVHKIDRLARNVVRPRDHPSPQTARIRLASVVENVDDTVSGQLVENIMASIAQFYSANLSEEVKKGMRQKVLKGGWPHTGRREATCSSGLWPAGRMSSKSIPRTDR